MTGRSSLHRLARAMMFGSALVLMASPFNGVRSQVAERAVDLELVLAVDSSDSVDDEEFALQIIGLADAFRHPDVIKALAAGPRKAIAVSMVEWADRGNQTVLIPWTYLNGANAARALAERIRATPRTYERGVTSVSGIIDFAVASFARNGFRGSRLVVDISSDGRQNDGRPLPAARAEALALGVTINALTILNEYGSLDDYYRREVIAGPSAFVETADDYGDYPGAILRKLVRELGSVPVVVGPSRPGPAPGHG
jgi:hypothetical protein